MSSATMNKNAQDNIDRAKDNVKDAADKAKDAAGNVADKAKEAAHTAGDKVKEAAGHVGQAFSSAAAAVGHKAEDAAASVGSGIQHVGEKVRQHGPSDGILGKATDTVAGALEDSGKYIQDHNLSGIAEDLTNVIRRNPVPALFVGLGLGFLLARSMRS